MQTDRPTRGTRRATGRVQAGAIAQFHWAFAVPRGRTGMLPGGGGDFPVPEPASLVVLGSALAGFGLLGRRRRRKP